MDVTVHHKDESITFTGLIDSGCDTTMMSLDIATAIGIKHNACVKIPVRGIAGAVEGCLHEVVLQIQHFNEKILMPVIFAPKLAVPILLGQRDFFQNFRVKFQKDDNTFELSRAPQPAAKKKKA